MVTDAFGGANEHIWEFLKREPQDQIVEIVSYIYIGGYATNESWWSFFTQLQKWVYLYPNVSQLKSQKFRKFSKYSCNPNTA